MEGTGQNIGKKSDQDKATNIWEKISRNKKPCRIGGGGEEEKDPGGDHDEAGWYVVQEDVPDQCNKVKMTNMLWLLKDR